MRWSLLHTKLSREKVTVFEWLLQFIPITNVCSIVDILLFLGPYYNLYLQKKQKNIYNNGNYCRYFCFYPLNTSTKALRTNKCGGFTQFLGAETTRISEEQRGFFLISGMDFGFRWFIGNTIINQASVNLLSMTKDLFYGSFNNDIFSISFLQTTVSPDSNRPFNSHNYYKQITIKWKVTLNTINYSDEI